MSSEKPVFVDKDVIEGNVVSDTSSTERRLSTVGDKDVQGGDVYYKLPFWTRMGCTPESFKRRSLEDKNNQLNQTLRSRHMHMIAIGMYSCPQMSMMTNALQVALSVLVCSSARAVLCLEVAQVHSLSTSSLLVS